MTAHRDIEEEFGEPMRDIVRGFAEDGYSMTATAQILDLRVPTFIEMCRSRGWSRFFSGRQDQAHRIANAEREMTPEWEGACRKNAPKGGATRGVFVEYGGITDTLAGHARRRGLSPKTVQSRHKKRPGDLGYVLSTVSHVRPPANNKSHKWRSDHEHA